MAVAINQIRYRCKKCNRLVSVKLPHSLSDMSAYCDNYSDDYEPVSESLA